MIGFDDSHRPLTRRERLTTDLWSRTSDAYAETNEGLLLQTTLRFYNPGLTLPDGADEFALLSLGGTFREWLMFDVSLDGRTPVERRLSEPTSLYERRVLESWRDSVCSLYRVELLFTKSKSVTLSDLARGGEVRVEVGSLIEVLVRGTCFATRLIRHQPGWAIEASMVLLPDASEAQRWIEREYEKYVTAHPGTTKDAFLKANGHLFFELWTEQAVRLDALEREQEVAEPFDVPPPKQKMQPSQGDEPSTDPDEPSITDPDAPCSCGSGKKYGWCCVWSDPEFLAGIQELANLPASDEPTARPERWQADLVRFPPQESPVRTADEAYVVVCPVSKWMMPLAIEPVSSVPERVEDLAELFCDALLVSVHGFVEEFPEVVEVRDVLLVEPLQATLAPFDVRVEAGQDFEAMRTEATKIFADFMSGGRATSE